MPVSKKQASREYAYYDKMAELKRKMPISWFYLIGSAIIWIFLSWALYKGIVYGCMYMRIDDSDLQSFCEEEFNEDVTENFDRLQDVPKGDAWAILPALGLSAKKRPKKDHAPVDNKAVADPSTFKFPPIVTAVTSDDFVAVQGLIQQVQNDIRPMLKDKASVKLIIYQLSLTTSEREVLSRHCNCIVRDVDARKFPPHVFDWYTNSWKAVLIQFVLKEFGSAMWVEPAARLIPQNLEAAVAIASHNGYVLWPEVPGSNVVAYTHPDTFKFYKEHRCTYKDTVVVDSTAMVLYATDFTLRGIMTPWLKCVLTQSCISPPHSQRDDCLSSRAPLHTGCHKFDQSALSIVVNRLLMFSENIETIVPKYRIAEKRDELIEYFPERPWTRKHRNMIIYLILSAICCSILITIFGTFCLECMGLKFKMVKPGLNV